MNVNSTEVSVDGCSIEIMKELHNDDEELLESITVHDCEQKDSGFYRMRFNTTEDMFIARSVFDMIGSMIVIDGKPACLRVYAPNDEPDSRRMFSPFFEYFSDNILQIKPYDSGRAMITFKGVSEAEVFCEHISNGDFFRLLERQINRVYVGTMDCEGISEQIWYHLEQQLPVYQDNIRISSDGIYKIDVGDGIDYDEVLSIIYDIDYLRITDEDGESIVCMLDGMSFLD